MSSAMVLLPAENGLLVMVVSEGADTGGGVWFGVLDCGYGRGEVADGRINWMGLWSWRWMGVAESAQLTCTAYPDAAVDMVLFGWKIIHNK